MEENLSSLLRGEGGAKGYRAGVLTKGMFGMAPEQNSKEELSRTCQTP
jgi:hypothetical protein